MRTRKVTENQADEGQTPTRKSERLYMDSFEIFREYEADGTTVKVERETLHIRQFEVDDATEEEVKEADQDSENENRSEEKEQAKELRRAKKAKDDARVAIVERRTKGKDKGVATLTRYQLNDHLGTVAVELTDKGWTLSYEEYSPYGTTTIQTNRSNTHVPKRYRFTGKERDSENGLSYHGARYLAPWLGRWVSVEPEIFKQKQIFNSLIQGQNLLNAYTYANNNPVKYIDPDGNRGIRPRQSRLFGSTGTLRPIRKIKVGARKLKHPPLRQTGSRDINRDILNQPSIDIIGHRQPKNRTDTIFQFRARAFQNINQILDDYNNLSNRNFSPEEGSAAFLIGKHKLNKEAATLIKFQLLEEGGTGETAIREAVANFVNENNIGPTLTATGTAEIKFSEKLILNHLLPLEDNSSKIQNNEEEIKVQGQFEDPHQGESGSSTVNLQFRFNFQNDAEKKKN